MANWWLTVNKDLSFRKALADDDTKLIKKAMKDVIQEVIKTCSSIKAKPYHTFDVDYVKEEFQELLDEIEIEDEYGSLNDKEDINHYLTELYDLCDNTRIFIAI